MKNIFYIKRSKALISIGLLFLTFYSFEFFKYGFGTLRLITSSTIVILILISSNFLKLSRIEVSIDELIFYNPLNIKYKVIAYTEIEFARLHSDRLYILKKDGRNIQVNKKQMEMTSIEELHQLIEQKL